VGRKQGWLEEAAVGLEPGSSLCALGRLLEHQLLSTELQNTVHVVVREEGHWWGKGMVERCTEG